MSHVRRLSALLLAASLNACGGDAKAPTAPALPIATATVTAATTTLVPGQSTQLVASAATAGGQAVSAAAFTWLSEAPAVATVPRGISLELVSMAPTARIVRLTRLR